MHRKISLLLAVLFALAAAAAAHAALAPSNARAIHDVKVELVHQYSGLVDISRPARLEPMPKALVDCHRLTDTLYRCAFLGKNSFFAVSGDAKVRFYKYDSDVKLYNVKCYYLRATSIDWCNG